MSIGRERYSYQAAVEGTAHDVPAPLMEVVMDREHWSQKWATALRYLYDSAQATHGNAESDPTPSVWEYTRQITDSDQEHHDYMRAVIYRAKQDPRYWGVSSDQEERYCARCRDVKPREDFDDGFVCGACRP